MYVCLCHGITDRHIAEAVSSGAKYLKDLNAQLRLGTRCGRCQSCAKRYLKQSLNQSHNQQSCPCPSKSLLEAS